MSIKIFWVFLKSYERRTSMAKKPKEKWQIEVRARLEDMGIGYKELAERIPGMNERTLNKAMCTNRYPGIRKKICDYLNIESEGA
jgi:DNA-binding HxlR family transcriptional regulator